MSGTSMACPNVAGLVALILARYPDLTNEQVREALRNTADDLGTPGFDPYFGYGRINADSALRLDRVGPLAVAKWTIDDDGTAPSVGNGDGVINAGETVEMSLAIKNRGGRDTAAVTGVITTDDPNVTMTLGTVSFTSVPRWTTVVGLNKVGTGSCAFGAQLSRRFLERRRMVMLLERTVVCIGRANNVSKTVGFHEEQTR